MYVRTQTDATECITLLHIRAQLQGNDLIQLLCQVVNQSFKLLAVIYMYLFWYFHRLICCEAVSRVICSTRELLVR